MILKKNGINIHKKNTLEMKTRNNSSKRERAEKRIKDLKGFYSHLMVYAVVNIIISAVHIVINISAGESFTGAFFNFGTFSTWIFWGIGIFFHGAKVFGFNLFFGKDWEERKIKQYLEENQNDVSKYR